MKKKAKIVLAAAAAVAAGLGLLATSLLPLQVEVVRVASAPVELTFTEQGSYGYDRVYTVYPIVAGEVLEVKSREGATVRQGDVLAVVNASDYQYQIEQLRSAIAGYNGQVSNLWLQEQQRKDEVSSTLETLKGQLTTLDAELEMNQGSNESLEKQIAIQEDVVYSNRNLVSHAREALRDAREYGDDIELDQARQAYAAAQNTLGQSELLLEQLRSGDTPDKLYDSQREALEAQIESLATQMDKDYAGGLYQYYNAQIAATQSSIAQMEEKAGQAEITAPVSGIVSTFPLEDQNLISQQAPVATIGSDPCVEVFVSVRDIDSVAVGDTVELLLDRRLGKESMTGKVIRIEDEAQIKLSALGVEERKIRVLVRPGEDSLQIGFDADVRFTAQRWDSALTVPKTAIFSRDGGDFVWVVEGDVLALRQVTKGPELDDACIIEDGLEEGDIVIADSNNEDLLVGKKAKF